MIKFNRYPHVNDLLKHYAVEHDRKDILTLLENDITNEDDAEALCRFAWLTAGYVNEDEERGNEVLGSKNNSEMLPDLSYEVSTLMNQKGYYSIWVKISNEEIEE